ncbi:hypothetical protein [Pseudactinotalea sp. Z1732]|uniref:hypothetical protein n=1 Tax=Micrococcales TaxID=85006 RepID=UPI003C7ED0B1
MTTTTRVRPNWIVATRTLIGAHLRVAVWLWGALVLLLIAAHILMSGIIPTRVLVAPYGTHASTWFAFSLALIFVLAYLPVHVLSGMTRRAFIRANVLTALIMGVLYGAALYLLAVLESLVFPDAAMLLDDGPMLGSGATWGMFVGQWLLSTTAIICGLLVAMAYYRTSALLGTVLLIPTVGPVLVVIALTASDAPIQAWLGLPTGAGWAVAFALIVIATGAFAFHLVTRNVPINSVESS